MRERERVRDRAGGREGREREREEREGRNKRKRDLIFFKLIIKKHKSLPHLLYICWVSTESRVSSRRKRWR